SAGRWSAQPWWSPPSPMRSRTGSPVPSVSYQSSCSPTRTRGIGASHGGARARSQRGPPTLPRVARRPYGFRMQEKFTRLTPELYAYVLAHNPPPDDVLADLAKETAALGPISMMQVSVEQGAFLTLLARLLGVRRAIEIGTFTGYSAISIARGLAPGGTLLCCDVSEEWTAVARRYFARAGLDDRITLRVAPALETIRALPETPEVDLVFIDADKTGYRGYYEALLPRMRP